MSALEAGRVYDPNQKSSEPINAFDRQVWESIGKMGQFAPKDFLSYMVEYLSLNQPLVPIGQVVGFTQFTAQPATTITAGTETTSSTTYVDLTTPGPTLTALPNGRYLVLFGAIAATNTAPTQAARMSISVNGGAAGTWYAQSTVGGFTSIAMAATVTLDAESNTITAKYLSTNAAAVASFDNRWMLALRYSNT